FSLFFFSSRRRHTRFSRDWSSDVCSSDLIPDGGFDLVLCIDVFEHIEDYLGFLRILRDKGTYKLFHIPLDMTVLSVLKNSQAYTDRKSTRLNSSHVKISYAVFCLKKKKKY